MAITIRSIGGTPVAWNGTRAASIGEIAERMAKLEAALREIATWQNMEGVGGQAIAMARKALNE